MRFTHVWTARIWSIISTYTKMKIIESVGAIVPSRRTFTDPVTGRTAPIPAASHTSKSFATTIRPDIGENEAYKEALRRGEIGLQRPLGVNVAGVTRGVGRTPGSIYRARNGIDGFNVARVKTCPGRHPPDRSDDMVELHRPRNHLR